MQFWQGMGGSLRDKGKVGHGLARGCWVTLFVAAIMALVAERYEHCRSEIGRTQTAATLLIDRDGKDVLSLNYLCQISDSAQSLSECYDEKSLTYDLAERDRLPDVQTSEVPKCRPDGDHTPLNTRP